MCACDFDVEEGQNTTINPVKLNIRNWLSDMELEIKETIARCSYM